MGELITCFIRHGNLINNGNIGVGYGRFTAV